MSAPAAPAADAAPPKKGKKIILIAVCLVFAGAGAAFPMVVNVPAMMGKGSKDDAKKDKKDVKTAIVPFGDLTVNLSEDRLQRYLRVKVALLVDADAEKDVLAEVTKKKAAVKSAMITHLAGKSVKDVAGGSGVTRTQRELLERVEDVLYPDGGSKLKSVLFEEYVIQ